jgi:amidohydrolase
MQTLFDRIDQNVKAAAPTLLTLSHRIHAHPEILFQEVQASTWLADALEAHGFRVERGVGGLPTAFRADMIGRGEGPTIAFLSEYDALPEIGHACGHNVIATIGAGAGLALAPLMAELPGRISVIGTPAEEGGAGKVLLADAGVFDDVDAALMIHPFTLDLVTMPLMATHSFEVTYHGVPSHAAASPHRGVNALDAVRLAFAGVDALRQQLRQDARVHAIVTHGGDAANVIPERASLRLVARANDGSYLRGDMVPRLRNVFAGAALMTGCRADVGEGKIHAEEMRFNPPLEGAFAHHAQRRGRSITPLDPNAGRGSSDVGNLSQKIPALQGMLAIDDVAALHTADFARAAVSERGDTAVQDGAAILASMAAELLTDPAKMAAVRRAFAL